VAEFAEVQRSHANAANRIDHNCVNEKKSADEILNAMAAVQRGITEKFPFVKHIYIQPCRRGEQEPPI